MQRRAGFSGFGGGIRPRRRPGPTRCGSWTSGEYETTTGGIWRLAGVTDYFTKYEHEQIATVEDQRREAEYYRGVFNRIRPHEALGMRRPIEILTDPQLHPIHKHQTEDLVPQA